MEGDPLLGTQVERYRIERVISEGGMGRVYLGIQPHIGARVAIKVLSSVSPEIVERFFTEARAVNFIHHDNIVNIIDLSTLPDGRPFIVMEYLEGRTLRQFMRSPDCTPYTVGTIAIEVLSALAATHEREIVHRDLKPDNIFLTHSGRVKVLDFGVAKLLPNRYGNQPQTKTGRSLGTPEYMAPEQVSGKPVDPRTDLYSLGIVLFEMITDALPFTGANDFEMMSAHLVSTPRAAIKLRPDLPRAYSDVIARAISREPDARFQSAAEMSAALADVLAHTPGRRGFLSQRVGAEPAESTMKVKAAKKPPHMWFRVVTIAAVAIAAIALGVALLS